MNQMRYTITPRNAGGFRLSIGYGHGESLAGFCPGYILPGFVEYYAISCDTEAEAVKIAEQEYSATPLK